MTQSTNKQNLSFFYPLIVYFVVCAAVSQGLTSAGSMDSVMRQAVSSFCAGAAVYLCFIAFGKKQEGKNRRIFLVPVTGHLLRGGLIAILWLICAGVAMNNVIGVLGLAQLSDSYQQVQADFYSSDLLRELLALGLITPLAEELLYRQLMLKRLRESFGRWMAIVASALIFGVMHMNLVQTVYAFVLGLLLALLMETYQDVRVPFLGHAAANCISVLRGETDLFSWLSIGQPLFWPVTVFLLAVTLIFTVQFIHNLKS